MEEEKGKDKRLNVAKLENFAGYALTGLLIGWMLTPLDPEKGVHRITRGSVTRHGTLRK